MPLPIDALRPIHKKTNKNSFNKLIGSIALIATMSTACGAAETNPALPPTAAPPPAGMGGDIYSLSNGTERIETEKYGSQIWYGPDVNNLCLIPSPGATPTPPKRKEGSSISSYNIPEGHFQEVKVGDQTYMVASDLPGGDYQLFSPDALTSLGIGAGQVMVMEGSRGIAGAYQAVNGGSLAFNGLLLPVALINSLASGMIQNNIEGPPIVPVKRKDGTMKYVYLDELAKTNTGNKTVITIANDPDATPLEGSFPAGFRAEIMGNPFPPNGWKPPDKDPKKNCGVNLAEYFAQLLVDEQLGLLYRDAFMEIQKANPRLTAVQISNQVETNPVFTDFNKIQAKIDQDDQMLRDGGCYFYSKAKGGKGEKNEGSVFMDYKNARSGAYLKAGGYNNPKMTASEYAKIWNNDPTIHQAWRKGVEHMNQQFNLNMSTDQAMNNAKRLIDQYW